MQRKLLRCGMVLTKPDSLRRREYMKIATVCFMFLFGIIVLRIRNTLHSYYRYGIERTRHTEAPKPCKLPPDLGPISVSSTKLDLEELDEKAFPDVRWGGMFSPHNCTALHKVAIIVPYRDRKEHLPIFLNHMHQFLMKQQIEYGIFVVEQASRRDYFNRGKLLNVGFLESKNLSDWQCFIFHDVDLLPLDQRNLYSCPVLRHPRHHAAAVDRRDFKLPYDTVFSGVSAMTLKQFTDVNGFSNAYWGSDGENDEMVLRMHSKGYTISRYNMTISRYATLRHKPNPKNKNQRYDWHKAMMEAKQALKFEGLSTLRYSVKTTPHRLYTHFKADIGRSPTYPQLMRVMKTYELLRANRTHRSQYLDIFKAELTNIL